MTKRFLPWPSCLMVPVKQTVCGTECIRKKGKRERGREGRKTKILGLHWFILSRDGIGLQTYTYLRECLSKKECICLVCLNVYPSINSQTVNALAMTPFLCVACVFVGGLRDRQTVKDEPGYARPMETDVKFSRHFVYIYIYMDRLF